MYFIIIICSYLSLFMPFLTTGHTSSMDFKNSMPVYK
jgi:hypothetical protein